MKAKACIICGAVIVALLFASFAVLSSNAGADDGTIDIEKKRAEFIAAQVRPAGVEEKDWIAINEKAGYAVVRYASATVLEADLYLKTERGWCRAVIHNPASPQLLGR